MLGMKDTTLPNLKQGLTFLHHQNYQVMLRNSGGLAVVSDEKILNISYLQATNKKWSIDTYYHDLMSFLQKYIDTPLTHGEVKTAYCPGKYDLQIKQRKIAGMSQKKFKDANATMAYVSLAGNQSQRGELIKRFYHISQADETFPQIQPSSMTTLADVQTHFDFTTWRNYPNLLTNTDFTQWLNDNQQLQTKLKAKLIQRQSLLTK